MSFQQTCQMSGIQFPVRDEDLAFYDQISPVLRGKKYLIPAPRLAPMERERRRLAYRNERKLYRRTSTLSGKPIISFYHPSSPWIIYTHDEWWSDSWDAINYGRDFDFSRGFFEQFYDLQKVVPRTPLVNNKADNSEFCNFADQNRNCYLLTSANRNLDSYYGFWVLESTDCVDCLYTMKCELCYECIDCESCYSTNFSQNCENCIDGNYLYYCSGVTNCLLCVQLRNREQNFLLNQPSTKEEIAKTIARMKTDKAYEKMMIAKFEELKTKFPVKALNTTGSENVLGSDITNSRNVFQGFLIWDLENCSYVYNGLQSSNCQDFTFFEKSQWCYESMSMIGYGYRFTNFCRDSSDIYYCDNCHGCKNCFGCIGLRKKEYCIFNKQYIKEQYEELLAKIIPYMDGLGEWGEYFPAKYSLFGYNETMANDYFPLTKEDAMQKGYRWR